MYSASVLKCQVAAEWSSLKENVITACCAVMSETVQVIQDVIAAESSLTPETFQAAASGITQLQNSKSMLLLSETVRAPSDGALLSCYSVLIVEVASLQVWFQFRLTAVWRLRGIGGSVGREWGTS